MADQSIFTVQTPSNGDAVQPGGIVTAVTFEALVPGVVKGVRFWASTTVSGTYTGELYLPTSDDDPLGTGTGTLVPGASEVAAAPPTGGTWNTILFDTPVAIAANTPYRATLHNTDGRFVLTPSFAPFANGAGGVTNGDLWAPHTGDDLGLGTSYQGTFAESATPIYPSNSFNNSNYFIDVIFEADALPANGDAAFTLDLALASEGLIEASGSAGFGLVLTAAGVGDAPVIPPSEGESDLDLIVTLSGVGNTPPPEPFEGAAAFSVALALAGSGEAPAPGSANGSAAFSLALALASLGNAPGVSSGSAAFSLALAVATEGDSGMFRCTPVRSFSEVMP